MAKRSKIETEAIRDLVRSRSAGQCQCRHDGCAHHTGLCRAQLRARWGVHKKDPGGSFTALNLLAMCVRCQRNAKVREAGDAA